MSRYNWKTLFSSCIPITFSILIILVGLLTTPVTCERRHIINFRSLNLYPEGLAWDPSAEHFVVGSLHNRTIHFISDAGVVQTFTSYPSLPEGSTILGLTIDSKHKRLLAVIHSMDPLPPFNALAAYDLRTSKRIFLSPLPSLQDGKVRDVANDVAVDFKGNAFVTNSAANYIWKVNAEGKASIFSISPVFTSSPSIVDSDTPLSSYGLNGIAYVSKGYLLVVQTNTGKLFKVDEEDGRARLVSLNRDLPNADAIAIRKDGVVVAISPRRLWFLKSHDSWGEGVVYDATDLDADEFATSVAVGGNDRVYVLYGHVMEAIGENKVVGREMFSIEEVSSKRESGEDMVWIFVLIGLGLAYFCFWRFKMRQLISGMDKKIS